MNYIVIEPPFKIKKFSEMTKKDARQYFDWYIGEMPKHLSLLESKLIDDRIIDKLEYSEELLVPIWAWYETKISYRQMTKEEYAQKPLLMPDKVLTEETQMYGADIAMFLGEVFTHNCPSIEWGFYHGGKTVDGVNEPVLLGFKNGSRMNPRKIVYVLTCRSSTQKNASMLLDIYKIWKEDV